MARSYCSEWPAEHVHMEWVPTLGPVSLALGSQLSAGFETGVPTKMAMTARLQLLPCCRWAD